MKSHKHIEHMKQVKSSEGTDIQDNLTLDSAQFMIPNSDFE